MAPSKEQQKQPTYTSKRKRDTQNVVRDKEAAEANGQSDAAGAAQRIIHDDQMVTQLDGAYLGSVVVDVRALSHKERNRAIDERFIEKLSEAFKCGVRRFAQEDRLKVTTTNQMLDMVLLEHTTETSTFLDLRNSLTKKTSDPVRSNSNHGDYIANK